MALARAVEYSVDPSFRDFRARGRNQLRRISRRIGIGAWTDLEIKRAITKGIARDGRVLNPPMAIAWYSGMTESDLDAIIAWLRTVPPLEILKRHPGSACPLLAAA